MKNSFISQLLEITQQTNLSFDEVFSIAFDYGFVDAFGNITAELLENKKENDSKPFSNVQNIVVVATITTIQR